MNYTINITGSGHRTKKDGTQAVRFVVSWNKNRAYISTGHSLPPSQITKDGILRGKLSEKDFSKIKNDLNRIRQNINLVFESYQVKDLPHLRALLSDPGGRSDFIKYYEMKLNDRLALDQIAFSTYKAQGSSLAALKQFRNIINFSDLDQKFLSIYKLYLQRNGLTRNTIWNRLKDLRTYISFAYKEGHLKTYPFKGFKMPAPQSRINFLHESEFLALKNYFETTDNIYHLEALRPFLFSCYTGLRISDIKRLNRYHFIFDDLIKIEPLKTRRSETKQFLEINIPVHEYAAGLIDIKKPVIFDKIISEQKLNKYYKEIASILDITPFSFHYSRHTFATRFLRYGGKIEVLQKLLGHENIKTTMVYIHVETSDLKTQISKLS